MTGDPADLYAFRTPSLRNVGSTGPYGHAGAHLSLRDFVTDHLDPVSALARFDPSTVRLPALKADDFKVMQNFAERAAIAQAVTLAIVPFEAAEVADIVAFLHALTDPAVQQGRLGVPNEIPSGLPVPNPD